MIFYVFQMAHQKVIKSFYDFLMHRLKTLKNHVFEI